jgi:hypothetical protein
VGAAAVVVLDPKSQGTPQMGFRERNEPVQTLATNGANDPLADRSRFRTAWRCLLHAQAEAANRGIELRREDAVAVMDQIMVSAANPERLA